VITPVIAAVWPNALAPKTSTAANETKSLRISDTLLDSETYTLGHSSIKSKLSVARLTMSENG
jgi:hypothetical protein